MQDISILVICKQHGTFGIGLFIKKQLVFGKDVTAANCTFENALWHIKRKSELFPLNFTIKLSCMLTSFVPVGTNISFSVSLIYYEYSYK